MTSDTSNSSPILPADSISRRRFVQATATAAALSPLSSVAAAAAPAGEAVRELKVPLTDATHLNIDGSHRFRQVRGRTGLHVMSLHTRAIVQTDIHRSPRGTVSFWFSPLEDLTFLSKANQSTSNVSFDFPFLSDVFPGRNLSKAKFAVSFTMSYPAILARFASGGVWARMDYGLAPFVYAEKALLRRGCWYHLAVTWDRPGKKLYVYLNGMMAGHNLQADDFEEGGPELFLGNPTIVLSDLRLESEALADKEILARYTEHRPATNDIADDDLRKMLVPGFLTPLDLRRDESWKTAYECSFTKAGDLEHWTRQGPTKFLEDFRMESTAEGLFLKTPSHVDNETRMYLWSKRAFEGDQWIEFDFRVESPRGLALLVACASGMQREDFFADHGIPATGSMATILRDLRCYHWEFVRRVEAMRTDVETQYLAKNAVGLKMICRCVPRLEPNRWYRLRFIKTGARLHGSFDGQTVFDVKDDPFNNNGPVYDFGRIGLRQMYNTALTYRNLVVYHREEA